MKFILKINAKKNLKKMLTQDTFLYLYLLSYQDSEMFAKVLKNVSKKYIYTDDSYAKHIFQLKEIHRLIVEHNSPGTLINTFFQNIPVIYAQNILLL